MIYNVILGLGWLFCAAVSLRAAIRLNKYLMSLGYFMFIYVLSVIASAACVYALLVLNSKPM